MSAERSTQRPARTPEELHAILEDAFSRGDLDAYMDAYEDDATLIVPPEGHVAHGRGDIRAATAPILALTPRMTSVVRKKVEANALALTYAQWEIDGTDADGAPLRMTGRAAMVSRRRPDGTWKIVIDDPLSPA